MMEPYLFAEVDSRTIVEASALILVTITGTCRNDFVWFREVIRL